MEHEANFTPRFQGCSGIFNPANELTSLQNEELHYRKHVILGKEWGREIPRSEYRSLAKNHLDSLDPETIIEFCQAEDLAVVKYNLDTGELGLARRDDGKIKTFFRPNDSHYILRKLDQGLWGEPDIVYGFESKDAERADFSDDPAKSYLFDRLRTLSSELESQSYSLAVNFGEGIPETNEVILLLSRLCECRFTVYELEQRILSEDQEDHVFSLNHKIIRAEATLEAVERLRREELVQTIEEGLSALIDGHKELWKNADSLVKDLESFEMALEERDKTGFIMMKLRILQIHERLLGFDLLPFEYLLRKSDLYFRKFLYPLAKSFNFKQEKHLVFPENFFWRHLEGVY